MAKDFRMTWTLIRLELARSREFPQGSAAHGYLLRVPLDGHSIADPQALLAHPERAEVLRIWPDEPDQRGYLAQRGNCWIFSYAPGEADDEPVFHLETHPLRLGEYVTITERDGKPHAFRITECETLAEA